MDDDIAAVLIRPHAEDRHAGQNRHDVKTINSVRRLPLHPRLVELGLLERAAARKAAGEPLMWDGLLFTVKSGYGKYPGRDFKKLSVDAGVYVERRKVFHSFRATIAQALEAAGLEGQLIDRFIGHKVNSTRMKSYSRNDTGSSLPIKRVYEVLKQVRFPINVLRVERFVTGNLAGNARAAGITPKRARRSA